MSDLVSREKAINAVYGMARPTGIDESPYEFAEYVIGNLPSADIMECARAIKEYCEKRECEKCDFVDRSISRSTLCGLHYACPCGWDLPEGEKGGNDDNT